MNGIFSTISVSDLFVLSPSKESEVWRIKMRALALLLMSLIFLPVTVLAGPLYGTIRQGPNLLGSKPIKVACPDFERPSFHTDAQTDSSGSFRINVTPNGRCMFQVEQFAPIAIFSSDNPIRYDFEVVNGALRRR